MPRPSSLQRILVGALVAVAITLGPVAAWAFTATLTIPDICPNPIAVGGFSMETFKEVAPFGGAAGTKAIIKPIILTKAIDDCSPLLFRALFLSHAAKTATLVVGIKKTSALFTIQLGTVSISDLTHRFATLGPSANDDVLVEEATLVPGTVAITSGGTTVECDQIRNACD